jgi:hypothetical protein
MFRRCLNGQRLCVLFSPRPRAHRIPRTLRLRHRPDHELAGRDLALDLRDLCGALLCELLFTVIGQADQNCMLENPEVIVDVTPPPR